MRLEVRQLTKRFETAGERIELFNAFNLELNAGEVKVLMGPSGSGKTTLLKMLCGLEQPDGGTIDYDGKDLYAMSDEARRTFRRANIGFADQAACLLPQLTALENVLLPAIGEREDHRETARKWLSRFGLEKRQDFFPSQLSGGERQRVALARALLLKPARSKAKRRLFHLHTGGQPRGGRCRVARDAQHACVGLFPDPYPLDRAMTFLRLFRRDCVYYRKPFLALAAGAALISAILTGALLIGDSVRGTLHDRVNRNAAVLSERLIFPFPVETSLAGGVLHAEGVITISDHLTTKVQLYARASETNLHGRDALASPSPGQTAGPQTRRPDERSRGGPFRDRQRESDGPSSEVETAPAAFPRRLHKQLRRSGVRQPAGGGLESLPPTRLARGRAGCSANRSQ